MGKYAIKEAAKLLGCGKCSKPGCDTSCDGRPGWVRAVPDWLRVGTTIYAKRWRGWTTVVKFMDLTPDDPTTYTPTFVGSNGVVYDASSFEAVNDRWSITPVSELERAEDPGPPEPCEECGVGMVPCGPMALECPSCKATVEFEPVSPNFAFN